MLNTRSITQSRMDWGGSGEEVAITSARRHPGTVCELRSATLCCSTPDHAAVSRYTELKARLRQIVFSGAHHSEAEYHYLPAAF